MSRDKVRCCRGYTVVELLVSMCIVTLLLAILLPSVQGARESARAFACRHNLRQIGLALHNYHDVHNRFPMGAFAHPGPRPGSSTVAALAGLSFWVPLLPFLDESPAFFEFVTSKPGSGDVLVGPNGGIARRARFSWLQCPSASGISTATVGNVDYLTPAYAGISGAAYDGEKNADFIKANAVAWPACRMASPTQPPAQISWGGLLCANVAFRMVDATDGLSNVLLVGECSNRVLTSDGVKSRIDAAFGLTGTWIRGTDSLGLGPQYLQPVSKTMTRPLNLTVIAHSVNVSQVDVDSGCLAEYPNRPLRSAHLGAAHALRGDGGVRELAAGIDLLLLKRLSTRGDGCVTEW